MQLASWRKDIVKIAIWDLVKWAFEVMRHGEAIGYTRFVNELNIIRKPSCLPLAS